MRVINLEDNWDNTASTHAQTYQFDVNAWARRFYLDANQHLVSKVGDQEALLSNMTVNVTEMNLGGSITLEQLSNQNLTKWQTEASKSPPKHIKPEDVVFERKIPVVAQAAAATPGAPAQEKTETVFQVGLEPQRIRTFKIKYER